MRYFFFFLLLFHFQLSAQISITGKILSDESGEPVTGASVYINNSTIGASSGSTGEYRLGGVLPGTYEIIVSHVAYEPIVHRVEIKTSDLRFTFRLQSKVKVMRDILIQTKDQRKAKMKIFREQFLGQTQAADNSIISNEEEVLFEGDESPSAFKAFSETPLIIINKELGYRISFELKEFFIDMNSGRTYFYGFTRYEDLDKKKPEKFQRNRNRYYQGSTMHLYQSMTIGNAEQQGFIFYKVYNTDMDGKGKMGKTMSRISADSLVYLDSGLHKQYLDWKGEVVIQYNQDPYHKRALARKFLVSGSLPKGIQTKITMLDAPAYLDANGLLENPLAVQYDGFWGYERLANMLPVNYKPGD